jgi:uncharacterized MAPEG superfamily protein
MTTELRMLLWSAVLCLIVPNLYVTGLMQVPGGLTWGLGNRDTPVSGESAWAMRARRAHANLVENLLVFAILVLIVQITGRGNAWTALGSRLFFWGRVGHLVTYLAGLVPWRTLAFAVAIAGEWIIAVHLLTS